MYYIPDCKELPQACSDSNTRFICDDIQLSREVQVKIGDDNEVLMYRASPCNGIKVCPVEGCEYVAPVSAQRPCKLHPKQKLVRSSTIGPCPVVFAYMYPKNVKSDHH